MNCNLKLYHAPILHFSISKVMHTLLCPFTEFTFEDAMMQLTNTTLSSVSRDDYVLSFEIFYDKNISSMLANIGKAICVTNKFDLVISTRELEDTHVLYLDFIHHKLHFLIDEILSATRLSYVPADVIWYWHNLIFKIKNPTFKIKNMDKLIVWAKESKIPENIFPYNKKELRKLRVLDLSGFHLKFLPPEIALLQNLRELNLSNNSFDVIPYEIYTLKNLRKLEFANNNIYSIEKEINNLSKLKVLNLQNNNLQNSNSHSKIINY